jgi:hypothetical protein
MRVLERVMFESAFGEIILSAPPQHIRRRIIRAQNRSRTSDDRRPVSLAKIAGSGPA